MDPNTSPLDLNELAKTSYATATEKGWWSGPERSDATLLLLMLTEISEAMEDFRAHKDPKEIYFEGEKPCGIAIELADFIIRIADYAGHKKLDFYSDPGKTSFFPPAQDLMEAWARASYAIMRAYEFSGKSWEGARDASPQELQAKLISRALKEACLHIFANCEMNGIDIVEAIRIKAEYNKTRPVRHGGKKV